MCRHGAAVVRRDAEAAELARALKGKRVRVVSTGSWADGWTGRVVGNLHAHYITVELDGDGPRYAAEADELKVIG